MWIAFPKHNSPEPVAVDVAIYPTAPLSQCRNGLSFG